MVNISRSAAKLPAKPPRKPRTQGDSVPDKIKRAAAKFAALRQTERGTGCPEA